MAIIVNLDMMLAKRKMTSLELANRVGMTPANLSILKTGKAKAVRMSTMDAICRELQCQPGDLFEFVQDDAHGNAEKGDIYGRTDAAPVSCGKTGTDFWPSGAAFRHVYVEQHSLRRFLSGICPGGGGSDGVQFLVSASLRLPAGEV